MSRPTQSAGAEPDHEHQNPRLRRVGVTVGPLLFLLILFAPGIPLSVDQRKVAAVTALTATWWITTALPIGATSLLPAALFPLLGVVGAREVAPKYMQDLVFLFLGAFVIALGLQRWNLHRRIALFLISVVGTKPRSLVLGFMIAAAFLSLWINNTSTTLLMLPIGVAVVTSVRKRAPGPSDPFAMSLLLGLAYSASVGGMGTPVGTVPNQVLLGGLRESFPDAPHISFGEWVLAWIPLVVLFVPVGWLILTRFALRVDNESTEGAEAIRAERGRLGPMARPEKTMAVIFGLTAFLWVTRAGLRLGSWSIPGWVGLVLPDSIAEPEKFISDATVATVMALVCFLIPVDKKRGVYLMDWRTAKKLPWEVLLLIGAGFAIAGAFQTSGLDRELGSMLGPLLEGRSSWWIVLMVVIFMAALTEVTSNTATAVVLLPVLGQAASEAGISPLLTMMPATIAASAAFRMLPVATPPNAVVFSSRLVPTSTMARVGLWLNVALAILITAVFQLWGRAVLSIGESLPAWAQE